MEKEEENTGSQIYSTKDCQPREKRRGRMHQVGK
jgi:hypothetical protein